MEQPHLLQRAEQCIEVHDWDDPGEHSGLIADFARAHVLITIFDGNIAKWLEMIDRIGTKAEKAGDAPFLRHLQQRLRTEPRLVDDLTRVVSDFARLMTPPRSAA